jgi:hypothetical protein
MFRLLPVLGLMLMVLGALLFIVPLLLEWVPSLAKVPWIILFVYRKDGFVFATSPILIIISVASFLWDLLLRAKG